MSENQTADVTSGVLTVNVGWAYGLSPPNPTSVSWREEWCPYMIAEYAGFQISSDALAIRPSRGGVLWLQSALPFKFDVSSTLSSEEELTLSLFVTCRDCKSTTQSLSCEEFQAEPRSICLGLVKVNPFRIGSGKRVVDVPNGTGRAQLEISYTPREISPLKNGPNWIVRGRKGRSKHATGDSDLLYVEKKDSGRSYGLEVIDPLLETPPGSENRVETGSGSAGMNMASKLTLRSDIQHPFIAPLMFAFISSDGQWELLSPLASGGYLSDHVQRERRFGMARARYYAAELVCILEYLHGKYIIAGSLEMESVLLDSSGHISLCKPSLYALERPTDTDRDCVLRGKSPYPAPEDLISHNDRDPSRRGDWWSLGVILYELLTGLPPFYHKSSSERHQKIVHEDLQLPASLPSHARDILASLLDKDPARRLGANGAAQVKAHPFFDGWNWDACILRKLEPPFKPQDAAVVFWREPHTYEVNVDPGPKGELRELGGLVFEMIGNEDFPLCRFVRMATDGAVESQASRDAPKDEWDLIWEPTDGGLYFQNRCTGQRVRARNGEQQGAIKQGETSQTTPGFPTKRQLEDALEAALKTGYHRHVFSQLLSRYSLNLNFRFFDPDDYLSRRSITPLEWAIEHDRPDLVDLFLSHGANADFTTATPSRGGPALVRAVRQKSQGLVETLIPRTSDRVARTRALALAVEQEDTALVTTLLAGRVRCDFEEPDRPLPLDPFCWDYDSNLSREIEPEDLTPPLVRAARRGNLSLVKLLLEHGADPNVAYHVLGGKREEEDGGSSGARDSKIPAQFSCGRVVQIVMEMGFPDVVRALLDAGADIDLAQPAWSVPGHVCPPVPRTGYLEIMDSLKGIVAERQRHELLIAVGRGLGGSG